MMHNIVSICVLLLLTVTMTEELEKKVSELEKKLGETSKVCYVNREKKFTKFSGKPEEVHDFVSEIGKYVKNRFKDEEDKIQYILEHLEKKPKTEIQLRTFSGKHSADEVLDLIVSIFGIKDSKIQIQQKFFSRSQETNESLEDYSHALMTILIEMQTIVPDLVKEFDSMLKERMAEGVKELSLRRELKRLNIERPNLEFHEFRELAYKWISESTSKKGYATCAEVSTESMSFQNLEKLVKEQQVQLTNLTAAVERLQLRNPQAEQSSHLNQDMHQHDRRGSYRGFSRGRGYGTRRGNFQNMHPNNVQQNSDMRSTGQNQVSGVKDNQNPIQNSGRKLECTYCGKENHTFERCYRRIRQQRQNGPVFSQGQVWDNQNYQNQQSGAYFDQDYEEN